MPWTEITRRKYRRDELRFASDTTDAEWALLEPLMPKLAGVGRPRKAALREVVNAIFYPHRLSVARFAEGVSAAIHRAGILLLLA
jgi:transposase